MNKGLYITLEGIVGTGKTTQSQNLYRYLQEKYPRRNIIWTREPGGSEIAERIRTLVQGTRFKEQMEPMCEAYLYAASRAQTLRTVVKPVLETNGIVIADRSFITSLSYQGGPRNLGVQKVWQVNDLALGNILPDIVFYLKLNYKESLSRISDHDGDKFEKMGINFFRLADEAYEKASQLPQLKDRHRNNRVLSDKS